MFIPGMMYGTNLAPNCMGQWHFDETTGTNAADSSGNSRNLTTYNTPTWVAGKLDNCLNFVAASSQYCDRGNSTDFDFEYTDTFSFECWLNSTTTTNEIIKKLNSDSFPTNFRGYVFDANLGIIFGLFTDSTHYLYIRAPDVTIYGGTWKHVRATYNGNGLASGVHIYIDGVENTPLQVIQNNLGGGTIKNSKDFFVAASGNVGYFNGKLDEVVVYNKVLNKNEVLFRYNGGFGTERLN